MKTGLRTWGLAFLAAALMTGCGNDNATGGSGGSNSANIHKGVNTASSTKNWSDFIKEVENGRFQGTSTNREFYWQSANSSNVTNNSNCEKKGIFYVCSYSSSSSGGNQNYVQGISTRIIENDGKVLRLTFQEDDVFGNSLDSIKGNLVSRMKSATDVRKCVELSQHLYRPGTWIPLYYAYTEVCYLINDTQGRMAESLSGLVSHNDLAVLLRNESSKRYIFTQGGKNYLVDTTRPLGANPIGVSNADGTNMKVLYGSY